jgi:hypothetical protein
MVVDKDRRPAWRPPAIADVHEDEIAAVLAGPDGLGDLWEPQREVPGATTAADTIYRVRPLDDPVRRRRESSASSIPISARTQWRKLELIGQVANRVWGREDPGLGRP